MFNGWPSGFSVTADEGQIFQLLPLYDPLPNSYFYVYDLDLDEAKRLILSSSNATVGRVFRSAKSTLLDFSAVETQVQPSVSVKIVPNPAGETTLLTFAGMSADDNEFQLTDALGRVVRAQRFSGETLLFERQGLTDGVYFFRASRGRSGVGFSGKIRFR